MKSLKALLLILPACLLLQGCAIMMSSTLPVARPPERLNDGLTQQQVDRMYGAPIAAGMSAGGAEYVEQIQFVNGTPIGRKVMRIVAHSVLDALTCFIWELPGTFIEAAHSEYPEETYFVIYDAANRVVRAVPADSPEGQQLAAGCNILIFPEGTRSPDPKTMHPWHRGGVQLALRTRAPIQPVVLRFSDRILAKGQNICDLGKKPVTIAVKSLPQEPAPAGDLVNYHGPAVRITRKLTESLTRELN